MGNVFRSKGKELEDTKVYTKYTRNKKSTNVKPKIKSNILDDDIQATYSEILVYGYMRDVELLLSCLIPYDIWHICYLYYSYNELYLMYLPYGSGTPYCVKIRNDIYTQQKLKIFELNKTKMSKYVLRNSVNVYNWSLKNSSLCFKQNIKLPKLITKKICFGYNEYYGYHNENYYKNSKTDTYSLIFKRIDKPYNYNNNSNSLNWSKKCYVIAFNDRELYKNYKSGIIGFRYNLPNTKREKSSLLFSERYGLIAVGGGISIYNLSFRNKAYLNQNKKEWKWQSFGHLMCRRTFFSSVIINEDKILVVGGDKINYKSELINLREHRINRSTTVACHSQHFKSGIMYNNYNKRVFVAGGTNVDGKDEMYDIIKNKWYIFANSHYSFNHWPILYTVDNEIIYMRSSNDIKWIDLRENKKFWNAYKNSHIMQIGKTYRAVT